MLDMLSKEYAKCWILLKKNTTKKHEWNWRVLLTNVSNSSNHCNWKTNSITFFSDPDLHFIILWFQDSRSAKHPDLHWLVTSQIEWLFWIIPHHHEHSGCNVILTFSLGNHYIYTQIYILIFLCVWYIIQYMKIPLILEMHKLKWQHVFLIKIDNTVNTL